MSLWKDLSRFLEHSTPLLQEGLESLKDTRALIASLKPTVDALPELVSETKGLVVDARSLLRELSPMLVRMTRNTLEATE